MNNPETAREFDTSLEAYSIARQEQWGHCEVVLAFGDSRYDLVTLRTD